jgi:hypothetical protein
MPVRHVRLESGSMGESHVLVLRRFGDVYFENVVRVRRRGEVELRGGAWLSHHANATGIYQTTDLKLFS